MIQDIYPHKFDNYYKIDTPKEQDYICVFQNGEILLEKKDEEFIIPTYKHFKNMNISKEKFIYLFKIDDKEFYLLNDVIVKEFNDLYKKPIRIFRELKENHMSFAIVTAWSLYKWYLSNKYCGTCGHTRKAHTKERALYCEACKSIVYPTISPAVMVGIINDDKILLTKYAQGEYKNYSLVAGFVETGETLEDTVKREVMEEVGLKVKNISYYKSQPWGLSNSIIVGFFAELDGDDTVILDRDELSEASWFKFDEIVLNNSKLSLNNEMINTFIKRYV